MRNNNRIEEISTNKNNFELHWKKFLELQNPKNIRYITCSGGGAKGPLLFGGIEACNQFLNDIERVGGASIGSVASALIATGNTDKKHAKVNMAELKGDKVLNRLTEHTGKPFKDYIDQTISKSIFNYLNGNNFITKERFKKSKNRIIKKLTNKIEDITNQKELVNVFNNITFDDYIQYHDKQNLQQQKQMQQPNIKKEIFQYLEQQLVNDSSGKILEFNNINNKNDFNQFIQSFIKTHQDSYDIDLKNTVDSFAELQDIKYSSIKSLKDKLSTPEGITFADLRKLELLEPKTFKGLDIVAVREHDGTLIEFNAKNTPNVKIASAVRASAALPWLFVPETIPIDDFHGGKYQAQHDANNSNWHFLDGGLKNNVPTDLLIGNKTKLSNGRIINFLFAGDDIHNAVHSEKKVMYQPKSIAEKVLAHFATQSVKDKNFKYVKSHNEMLEKNIRKYALHNIILNPGRVGTADLEAANKLVDLLITKGKLQTQEYLLNHDMIAEEKLPSLQTKLYMVSLYEEIEKSNLNTFTLSEDKKEYILSEILKFCDKDSDNTVHMAQHLSKLTISLCKEKPSGNKIIDQLVKDLNSPSIPNEVKHSFAEILNKEYDKIADLKFNIEEFKNYAQKTIRFSDLIKSNKETKFLQSKNHQEGVKSANTNDQQRS